VKGEALTKKEKEVYKKKLLEKKENILKNLSEFYNQSKEVETDIAKDVADKAESSYTKEFLLSLSDAERNQLFLIDGALKRIEKCEYGVCLMCRKDIGKKRLNAVPWAPFCIDCQEKAESEST
jgi:DnaK suppressor protein